MNEKLEGTLALDGMIEGRLPPEGEIEQKLNDWVRFAGTFGLRFSLEIDGNTFSVLADHRPVDVAKLAPDAGETVRQCVDQLVQAFPAPQRPNLFSTLRSSEWRPGKEVQAIYALGPDGRVQITERTVDAQTVAPAAPLAMTDRLKLAGLGLLIAAAVLGVSALFIDYGAVIGNLRDATKKVSVDSIDHGPFTPFVKVAGITTKRGRAGRYLELTLERTDAYPTSAAQLQAMYARADGDLFATLTVEALARGEVTVEMYDDRGALVGSARMRIAGLASKQTATAIVPAPNHRPETIRLNY